MVERGGREEEEERGERKKGREGGEKEKDKEKNSRYSTCLIHD